MTARRTTIVFAVLAFSSSLGWVLGSELVDRRVHATPQVLDTPARAGRSALETIGSQPLDENWPGVPREIAAQIARSSPLAELIRGLSAGRSSAPANVSAFAGDPGSDDSRGPAETRQEIASALPAIAIPESPASKASRDGTTIYNFDQDAAGKLPPGFQVALTGRGSQPVWVVQADATAPSQPNLLAQTSADNTDYRFPLAIAQQGSLQNLSLSVKFKAVAGSVDRAAGLVFRLQDANNYYVVRANALEDNFNFYRVVNGRRSEIKGSKVKVPTGEWREMRIEAESNRFKCFLDGKQMIDTTDETFAEAGKIGLWTKADSVTYFDNLQVTPK